jgi:hypothetical protein|tara:strand:- start:2261 stop:2452 length:192 start_codon:yes stop_codon:yes gene_type:complete
MYKKFFTPREASDFLNVSVNTLRRKRSSGQGPKFKKFFVQKNKPRSGVVRYPVEELIKFVKGA